MKMGEARLSKLNINDERVFLRSRQYFIVLVNLQTINIDAQIFWLHLYHTHCHPFARAHFRQIYTQRDLLCGGMNA
jgi:hypothetical protein